MAKPLDREGNRRLAAACDFLEHYHLEHTDDTITRFRRGGIHIYIVSDPYWQKKIDYEIRDTMEGGKYARRIKH